MSNSSKQNTFLSRVFEINTGNVESPNTTNISLDSHLNDSSMEDNTPATTHRIIESDQESSSDEEDTLGENQHSTQNSNRSAASISIEEIGLSNNNKYSNFNVPPKHISSPSDGTDILAENNNPSLGNTDKIFQEESNRIDDSSVDDAFNEDNSMYHFRKNIGKLGQISSDEEDQNTEDDDEEDDYFTNNKIQTKQDIMKSSSSLEESHDEADVPLFEKTKRIHKGNKSSSRYRNHNKKRSFVQSVLYDNSLFIKPSTKNDTQDQSFLFRKKSTWENEPPKTYNNANFSNSFFSAAQNNGSNKTNNNDTRGTFRSKRGAVLSPRERALWKWANVENLDIFLQKVYNYYLGSGSLCIIVEKVLNLLTLLFVVFISTYSTHCVNYSKIPSSHKLSDILIEKCYKNEILGTTKFLLYIFYVFVFLKIFQIYYDIKDLKDMHDFYSYLLNISDKELETISWQSVVHQIMALKDQNALTANVAEVKAKNRIDAHDIANRIMRKENYLIALYNSDILELSLPLPMYRSSILTKTLEWNINLCVMGFSFNDYGYLKQDFLKKSRKNYLSDELKKRFMVAGVLNIILSPFLVFYFILLYFFRYFNEYKTSPSSINTRQYAPSAEWKFRDYNELYHMFQKRLGLSVEIADEYVNQFPNEIKDSILKFVAFISGSFAAILGVCTIFDPENFLNFEITKDRTVLFYLSVLGTVWAICKGSISNEYHVFDPETYMNELSRYTHYLPKEWQGRLHSEQVKEEFCKLYNLKVIILLRELTSLIMTPFILWVSLPKSSDKIIDFFRDVSVYVDGLGYVCKYALFTNDNQTNKLLRKNIYKKNQSLKNNFNNGQYGKGHSSTLLENEDTDAAEDKMLQSYYNFVDSYQNQQNAVGKTAIPRKLEINRNYSWRDQFGFKQSGNNNNNNNSKLSQIDSISPNSSLWLQRNKKSDHANPIFESDLFINTGSSNDLSKFNQEMDSNRGQGVLGLLKQYYRDADIGR
ncbi:autophagy protein ATG9 SCDLUD_000254 [Saccharomycodes ludwigii]|uniref:autophagy protein ATG9 n=1 Tax=Saccharomycodes ludwigii TaxID=36035 RepID=UPI001E8953FC|nr:hypothetical protein SCDLUD_000254 [Saccharomycodes ludwigii]KAH3902671.1 hypothetical protein SCDLUD_000254 [Saccharomycodes ludwigii]